MYSELATRPRGEPRTPWRPAYDRPERSPIRIAANKEARRRQRRLVQRVAMKAGLRLVPVLGVALTLHQLFEFYEWMSSQRFAGGSKYPGYYRYASCRDGPDSGLLRSGSGPNNQAYTCTYRQLISLPHNDSNLRNNIALGAVAYFEETTLEPYGPNYPNYFWQSATHLYRQRGPGDPATDELVKLPLEDPNIERALGRKVAFYLPAGRSLPQRRPVGVPPIAPLRIAPDLSKLPEYRTEEVILYTEKGVERVTLNKPSQRPSRTRPPTSIPERKFSGDAAAGVAIFAGLQQSGATGGIVRDLFDSLPRAVQARYEGQSAPGWRFAAIFDHLELVDWSAALLRIALRGSHAEKGK